eukprot:TRINITY_DN8175_c0_g1_i1.p3 TRINITY_DN8175_c0_g1~~TRINITY_DN8175_c0_g1_i1.p3  ORF type:complete len:107 (+),score=24.73 TRINITY_DN8175_c0_g1_i1:313-633(+)
MFSSQKQRVNVFAYNKSNYTIGKNSNCSFIIPECPYDIAAEIGFIEKEGWYIKSVKEDQVVLVSMKRDKKNDQSQKDKSMKKGQYCNLKTGQKIYVEGYIFLIQVS